jgi:hypothetical protein
MRMDAKLFTLQMSLLRAEEPRENLIAIRNSGCCIHLTEDESEPKYLSSHKPVRQAEP